MDNEHNGYYIPAGLLVVGNAWCVYRQRASLLILIAMVLVGQFSVMRSATLILMPLT